MGATGLAGGAPSVDREMQDIYVLGGGEIQVRDVAAQEEEVEEVRYWAVDEYRRYCMEQFWREGMCGLYRGACSIRSFSYRGFLNIAGAHD